MEGMFLSSSQGRYTITLYFCNQCDVVHLALVEVSALQFLLTCVCLISRTVWILVVNTCIWLTLPLFQFIPDGYASHLSQLEYNQRSRPAKSASTRMVLRKGSFGLGAAGGDFLRKRNHIFRTISQKKSAGAGAGAGAASPNPTGRTERTLSQCEMERERVTGPATQRSMSIAAGCWGRTGSGKEGSGGLLGPK